MRLEGKVGGEIEGGKTEEGGRAVTVVPVLRSERQNRGRSKRRESIRVGE